jgi:hypothetical protein
MMNDIQEKLRQLLAGGPFNDEPRVTYLLVECRKLLERGRMQNTALPNLPTLNFYCNWALHIQLDQTGAQRFLKAVNEILTLCGNHTSVQQQVFDHLLTLEAFRQELRSLLDSFGADLAICDDPERWRRFLHGYARVVEDADLVLNVASPMAPAGPLNLVVKTVTIHSIAGDVLVDPAERVYPMVWQIDYADGRIGRLTLSQFGLVGAAIEIYSPASAQTSAPVAATTI